MGTLVLVIRAGAAAPKGQDLWSSRSLAQGGLLRLRAGYKRHRHKGAKAQRHRHNGTGHKGTGLSIFSANDSHAYDDELMINRKTH